MSDLRENPELEKAARQLQLEELRMNNLRSKYRLLQIDDERKRIEENIAATTAAIEDLEEGN